MEGLQTRFKLTTRGLTTRQMQCYTLQQQWNTWLAGMESGVLCVGWGGLEGRVDGVEGGMGWDGGWGGGYGGMAGGWGAGWDELRWRVGWRVGWYRLKGGVNGGMERAVGIYFLFPKLSFWPDKISVSGLKGI